MSTTGLEKNDHFNESVATFGDRLEAARGAKGLTVVALAQKLGLDVRAVEAWEGDTDEPRGNHMLLLAGMLNVSLVWLMGGEGNGTSGVADTYDRPVCVNDALGEIAQLKETLSGALEKLEQLEQRLLEV